MGKEELNFKVIDKRYSCLVAEVLGELMEKHKISRSELALATGVPYTTLQQWDEGSEPKIQSNIMKIAEFFGVSLEYFCYGIGATSEEYNQLIAEKEERIKKLELEMFWLNEEIKSQQSFGF